MNLLLLNCCVSRRMTNDVSVISIARLSLCRLVVSKLLRYIECNETHQSLIRSISGGAM